MRIKIYRGTKKIGGSCIELEARGARILFDLGLPLGSDPDDGTPHRQINGSRIAAAFAAPGIPLDDVHSSGHISTGDWWEIAV